MQLEVKKSDGVGYVNKEAYEYDGKSYEADLKIGDKVKILDGGIEEEGKFGTQVNFKLETRNGTKKISLNQTSQNVLVMELGVETEQWIGKEVNVLLKKCIINSKKCIVPYLVTDGYSLDEYGDVIKDENMKSVAPAVNVPNSTQDASQGLTEPLTAQENSSMQTGKPLVEGNEGFVSVGNIPF